MIQPNRKGETYNSTQLGDKYVCYKVENGVGGRLFHTLHQIEYVTCKIMRRNAIPITTEGGL